MYMHEPFQAWTEEYGVENLARELGVTPHSVWHWRAKRCWPKIVMILKMVALSDGKLSVEDIIRCTTPLHFNRILRKARVIE